ncbi:hypothetical protein XH92_39610 [Bradyrhizobium sp. CCBAU 53421]|nr:hypothetical protein XH92_39610 [Bradyrhizobium sp. CCBAU 53421]
MRPTTAYTNLHALKSLIPNERRFERPRDVFSDPSLIMTEKQAILASRASDATAIPSHRTWRAPKGHSASLRVDVILPALRGLDGDPRRPPGGKSAHRRSTARPLAA